MTHTPGPYEIVTADLGDDIACIVPVELRAANGKTVIAQSGGLAPDDEEWKSDELFSNAQLFAAAPDMLEALKGLYELVSSDCVSIPDEQYTKVAFAAAAIAKAEGRTA